MSIKIALTGLLFALVSGFIIIINQDSGNKVNKYLGGSLITSFFTGSAAIFMGILMYIWL